MDLLGMGFLVLGNPRESRHESRISYLRSVDSVLNQNAARVVCVDGVLLSSL